MRMRAWVGPALWLAATLSGVLALFLPWVHYPGPADERDPMRQPDALLPIGGTPVHAAIFVAGAVLLLSLAAAAIRPGAARGWRFATTAAGLVALLELQGARSHAARLGFDLRTGAYAGAIALVLAVLAAIAGGGRSGADGFDDLAAGRGRSAVAVRLGVVVLALYGYALIVPWRTITLTPLQRQSAKSADVHLIDTSASIILVPLVIVLVIAVAVLIFGSPHAPGTRTFAIAVAAGTTGVVALIARHPLHNPRIVNASGLVLDPDMRTLGGEPPPSGLVAHETKAWLFMLLVPVLLGTVAGLATGRAGRSGRPAEPVAWRLRGAVGLAAIACVAYVLALRQTWFVGIDRAALLNAGLVPAIAPYVYLMAMPIVLAVTAAAFAGGRHRAGVQAAAIGAAVVLSLVLIALRVRPTGFSSTFNGIPAPIAGKAVDVSVSAASGWYVAMVALVAASGAALLAPGGALRASTRAIAGSSQRGADAMGEPRRLVWRRWALTWGIAVGFLICTALAGSRRWVAVTVAGRTTPSRFNGDGLDVPVGSVWMLALPLLAGLLGWALWAGRRGRTGQAGLVGLAIGLAPVAIMMTADPEVAALVRVTPDSRVAFHALLGLQAAAAAVGLAVLAVAVANPFRPGRALTLPPPAHDGTAPSQSGVELGQISVTTG